VPAASTPPRPLGQRILRRWLRLRGLRPTRDGGWFILVLVGILVVALNTGNNQLYLLLGMLLTLVLSSWLLSEISLRSIVPRRQPPPRVHANHPFLMGIVLRNEKRRFPSFSIEVEDLCDDQVVDKRCYFLKIPSGRTQQTSYRHSLPRRGRYVFTAFRISTKFPFALFRASRYVEHRSEIVVYPALLSLSHLPQALLSAAGEQTAGRLGRRGAFHALRELRNGDDPRDIHWKSSARRQRLMVREYEDEAVQQVTLFVDNALSPTEAKDPQAQADLERVISWAASLGAYYLEHGYAVALIVRSPSPALSVLHSPSSLSRLLSTLALLETVTPDVPFQSAPRMPAMVGNQICQRGDSLLIVRPSRDERDRSRPPPIPGSAERSGPRLTAASMDSPSDPAARMPPAVAAAHVIEAI
jgi:uncharacterized protein (DUF58 family)